MFFSGDPPVTGQPFLHSLTCVTSSTSLFVFLHRSIGMALTPAESMELQRLLAKAKSRPMPNLNSDGEEFAIYDPHTGLFTNPETGDVMDVWSAAEEQHGGAMTDGSKRRDDDQPIPHHPKRVMVPQAKAYSAGTSSQVPALPAYTAVNVAAGVPFPDPSGTLPAFPTGVPDLATWGDTIIEFGQYKHQNMSYIDLVTATDDRSTGYVKWCRARASSASGQLKDLCDFLIHHFAEIENDLDHGPLIPGTSMNRRLKK